MPPHARTLPVTPTVVPPDPAPPRPTRMTAHLQSRMSDATPREVLVALRDPADLTGLLVSAAVRSRAERRPLSVVIVEPARGWTIDAAVIALQDRRRCREMASMTAAAGVLCAQVGVEVCEVLVLRPGWRWTRPGRDRAVDAQLRAIARHRGADLYGAGGHRGVPAPVAAHDITGRPYTAGSHRSAPHRTAPHRTAPDRTAAATVAGPAAGGDVVTGAR